MGLIETKLQLDRHIREAQMLAGNLQQTQSMIRYYSPWEDAVSGEEISLAVIEVHQAIENLNKQLKALENSTAYKQEYGERYAVYQEPSIEQTST
jgi:hypothetical protein